MTATPRSFAAALSGGPRSAVSVLVALVVLVAAGCNSAVVAPPATATATATPTVGPPGSTRPSAPPPADSVAAALSGFLALVTKPDFDYQATFTGQSRLSADILPIRSGLLQVSGADALVRGTWTLQGHHYTVEERSVGGKGWIRYRTTDPWEKLTIRSTDAITAFASVKTMTDLIYLGPVKVGGKTLFKVSFRSAIVNPVMIPAGNLSDTSLTSPKLTLLIDAAGTPVKGTAEIDGKGRISGQLQEIVMDLTVTFTKVGQAVTIKAP